ncbi:MAG: hypothetical protein LBQ84_02580 [Flavobacteriaceae bacterium]|jgi:hypothetical protein|nr:hypothetical protein [Flavobacteriaceae bacterium]
MKKIIIFLFILLPVTSFAQFMGAGVQYADARGKGNDFQFAANISCPIPGINNKNPFNSFISAGLDYTGGSSPVAGLNIKPVQISSFLSESFFHKNNFTVLVGCDAGYLFIL